MQITPSSLSYQLAHSIIVGSGTCSSAGWWSIIRISHNAMTVLCSPIRLVKKLSKNWLTSLLDVPYDPYDNLQYNIQNHNYLGWLYIIVVFISFSIHISLRRQHIHIDIIFLTCTNNDKSRNLTPPRITINFHKVMLSLLDNPLYFLSSVDIVFNSYLHHWGPYVPLRTWWLRADSATLTRTQKTRSSPGTGWWSVVACDNW